MTRNFLYVGLLALSVITLTGAGIAEGEPDPNTGPGKHDKALEKHDTTLIDDRGAPSKKPVKTPKKVAKKRH